MTTDDLREAGITGDEVYLTKLLNRVMRIVEVYTGRLFTQQDYDELYDGNLTGLLTLKQYPITGVTSVSVVEDDTITGFDEESLTLKEVAKYNWDVDLDEGPYGVLRINGMIPGVNRYRVKYQAGYAQLPYNLEQAIIELCGYYVSSAKSAGVKSETLGEYSITYGSGSSVIKNLGLDSLLDPYRTPKIA